MSFGKLASTFALLSTLLCVPGCDPQDECRSMCEKQEEADCDTGLPDAIDCERYCKHQLDLVTNADCQSDWDAYMLCIDELENVCDAYPDPCKPDDDDCDDPKCDNEFEELEECIVDYCCDNPRNNECSDRGVVSCP